MHPTSSLGSIKRAFISDSRGSEWGNCYSPITGISGMNYELLRLHHFGIHANSPTGAGGCFLGNGSGKVRKNSFQGTVVFLPKGSISADRDFL